MKRTLALLSPLLVAGCGGGGGTSVNLQLHSNDAAPAASVVASSGSALRSALTADSASDLTAVKSVVVTVNEVDVHFRADDGKDVENSADVPEDDKGWQTVSTQAQVIDLLSLRGTTVFALGAVTTSQAKLSGVRLKLKTDGSNVNGDDLIRQAVTQQDGTVCDLYVPHSAASPGLKVEGEFKSRKFTGSNERAELNLRLKNSSKLALPAGCAYHLSPKLELEDVGEVEHGRDADGGSHQ